MMALVHSLQGKRVTYTRAPFRLLWACIVSPENKILSLGYNGMPIGCSDDEMPWERELSLIHI